MINRQSLLADLQSLLKRLEADLLERSASAEVPGVGEALRAEYARAKQAERTAHNYEDWRSDAITQAAAAWVLSCVFVRFLEDNQLIDPPKIAGPATGEQASRLQRARDEHELYFRAHPTETDREYLLAVFDELATLPGTKDLFGEHNGLREQPTWLSGDAAGELLRFFQKIDPGTGELIHDFTDPPSADGKGWDTRFLGDLYQDLSEAARKKYALLQTPDFVEEFILDRTLEPALDEFSLRPGDQLSAASDQIEANYEELTASVLTANRFRMIDPACGSGHFLLGAFDRILARWIRKEPATPIRELVQRALDSVHGVDVNPYAVAIARFRLLLAAMRASGVKRLHDAPDFRIQVACGDSLYHGRREHQRMLGGESKEEQWRDESHYFHSENAAELRQLLREGSYHCVVANPPYIVPNDPAAAAAYRRLYSTCCAQYALSVPFMELIMRLGVEACPSAGFNGQIIASSFLKREFGKKLIEEFLPARDLSLVVDCSSVSIPGHATPTVMLFGRSRAPVLDTIRVCIPRSGDATGDRRGQFGDVWGDIVDACRGDDIECSTLSVFDESRSNLSVHPWVLAESSTAQLLKTIEHAGSQSIASVSPAFGRTGHTGMDDVFSTSNIATFRRVGVASDRLAPFLDGESVRDWRAGSEAAVLLPYDESGKPIALSSSAALHRHVWPHRILLRSRLLFGSRPFLTTSEWYVYSHYIHDRFVSRGMPLAEIATHIHMAMDGGKRFAAQTAPVLYLEASATDEYACGVLGLLNSSTALYWCKSRCYAKSGIRKEPWDQGYAFNASNVQTLPVTPRLPFARVISLQACLSQIGRVAPSFLREQVEVDDDSTEAGKCGLAPIDVEHWVEARSEALSAAIAIQEELDWECYQLYGLLEDDLTTDAPPPLELGERAFEIVMGRQVAAGELATTWFERHGSTPITELPDHWPDDYKRLVERRIELIESDLNIGLIERPEYKRRWSTEPWDQQVERALRSWLLDRLESYFDFDGRMNEAGEPTAKIEVGLTSLAKLADIARADTEFQEVGGVYRDDDAFDVERLVAELVQAEHVPLLPVLRYKESGLRKRAEWEKTWELQRREDAGEAVGDIPVPPRYKSSDFLSSGGARYWALRGKLDVPKERWVSFPHCEGPDGTLVIAWAGYDHLQLARAVSSYFVDVQERLGGRDDPRLVPLLAAIIELLPWLKQWHNEPSADYDGLQMGDYFEGFVTEEAKNLGLTVDEIKAWTPPQRAGRGRRRKA